MRHALAGNRLGRNSSLRKATVRDIAKATLIQQRVLTTKAKAKEARKLVDRLITLGKKGTLAGKRKAFSILSDHQVVSDLFTKTAPLFKNRIGGYTRIIALPSLRLGDNARLAYLELTEKTEAIISRAKSLENKKGKKQDAPHAHGSPDASSSKTADEHTRPPTSSSSTTMTQTQEPPRPTKSKSPTKWGGIQKMFRRKVGE